MVKRVLSSDLQLLNNERSCLFGESYDTRSFYLVGEPVPDVDR